MSVSRRLRYEILRRDDHTCRYCGAGAPNVKLTVDHVLPIALGGSDEASNLVTACADCNAGKSSSSPDAPIVEDVAADALRWAMAIREAGILQSRRAHARREYIDSFDEAWSGWTYEDGTPVSRPPDWTATIARTFEAGIEEGVLVELVNDVLPRRVPDSRMWRYFCGALRNLTTERADIARSLIESGEC